LNGTASDTDAMQVYRRLLRYAWPHRGQFLIGVVGMLMYAASSALIAYLVKGFLNERLLTQDRRALIYLPLGAIAIFVVRGVGDYLGSYFPGRVGRAVIKAIRRDLFAQYLLLPTARYDRESSGTLLTRLTYNTELVAQAATDSIIVIVRDSLTVVVLIAALFYLNWKLAAYSLIVAPAMAWLVRRVNVRFRRYSTRIQDSMGDVTRVAKEALDAHRIIKVFNAQAHIRALFERTNEVNRHTNVRLINARASSNPVVQLIASIGLAGVLFVAISQINRGAMSTSDFLAFLAALLQVSNPLRNLLNVAGPLQQGIAAGSSVFEFLDAEVEPAGGTRALTRARGEVEFRHVSFAYNEEKGEVLRDIDLCVPPNTTVAIVGRSGSGKSTLVSLLPRFYDPTTGQVCIDGVDVREYSIADLRAQISLVSQEVVLFNETIRNNILFGAPNISDAQLEAAVRAAHVSEFVDQLPQGLDTMVGDRGVLLSGGQRQRIAIARALLRDTPILILDEATSALDTASERHIQAALEQLVRNRTTFVIAHRLSTVEHADRIIVMQDGDVIEYGAHAQLLAAGGVYAQLHRLQFND
jgi:subfamily B ATP-binding cassette protein MsbA